MKPTEAFQEALYKEMLGRIKETDVHVPYRKGGYFYYSRTEQGKQYPIYCRKKGSREAPEEVILDLNGLAEGQTFMSLGAFAVSDDGNAARVFDGQHRLPPVHAVREGPARAADAARDGGARSARSPGPPTTGRSSTRSRRSRPSASTGSYRHRSARRSTTLVYEEKDEAFSVGVGRTRSRGTSCSASGSHTTSEARSLPADQPEGGLERRGAARPRPRVRRRPPRRPLLHPHQRPGPQLPAGDGARRRARAARAGRRSCRTART